MARYDEIIEAQTELVNDWGEYGKEVIEACFNSHVKMSMSDFLKNCSACGGNWGGMFLTGIKRIAPEVWEMIPDNMGKRAFADITFVLLLLGINATEKE